jgi:uncharacterized protein (DUF58 family)
MAARDASPPRDADLVFPLVPSRRSGRLDVAGRTSRRRGIGSEVAGSRPYRRGDAVRLVDWRASARLSTARAGDEFVVRDRLAEDVVRVVVVLDRSPTMRLFPAELPWLHKPDVVATAGRMILASARAAHALVGYGEARAEGPWVVRPGRGPHLRRLVGSCVAQPPDSAPSAPPGALDTVLRHLTRSADVTPGTFVFLLSDFLGATSPQVLRAAVGSGWDLVPVVVQDSTWERSFPDVAGVTLPLADPVTGDVRPVRLRSAEARARREANERRALLLHEMFATLGVDPVLLSSAEPWAVHAAFSGWARARLSARRAR